MSAAAITDYLVEESGRILDWNLRRRVFPGNPLLNLIPRETYPQGMGADLSVVTYERTTPTAANPTWTQMAIVDQQEGGLCLPTTLQVPVGSTKRTFYRYDIAVHGPHFCAVDLYQKGMLGAQLDAIEGILAGYIRILWELHDQDQYFQMCLYKVIVDGCPPSECSTFGVATWTAAAAAVLPQPATCPTSVLTQGVLDYYRMFLIRDGAVSSAMGFNEGSPILTLMTSPETSDLIKHELEEDSLLGIRDTAQSELLAPYGAGMREYKGFFHLKIPFLRRFSCNAGTITQISPWTMGAASKGQKATISSTWRTTAYEESVIFDRAVMTQMVPGSITNPSSQFQFSAVDYLGTLSVKNILHETDNPDGTIIFHRAVLSSATKPVHPELGVAFLHLRCDPACNLVTACVT
jgi:hypothetical protein